MKATSLVLSMNSFNYISSNDQITTIILSLKHLQYSVQRSSSDRQPPQKNQDDKPNLKESLTHHATAEEKLKTKVENDKIRHHLLLKFRKNPLFIIKIK